MLICLHTKVYLDIGKRDIEEVAASFDRGAERALGNFPDCEEVVQVDVDHGEVLTLEQITELGFDE